MSRGDYTLVRPTQGRRFGWDTQNNMQTQSLPNVVAKNTAQLNENCLAGTQHDTTTSASISSEGDRESFIPHWREAQTGQPAAGRTVDIPRERQ